MAVFDAAWFAAQQPRLLRVLNAPLVRVWNPLRLRHADPLDGIGPSWDRVALDVRARSVPYGPRYVVTYRTTCRTAPVLARRLRRVGAPLWWLLHGWDQTGRVLHPAWDAGFDTFTQNPDGTPESVSVDGSVNRSGVDEAWATIRAGAGVGANDNNTANDAFRITASATTDQWAFLSRGIFLFDTTPIGRGARVSAATFSVAGQTKSDALAVTPNLDVYEARPASMTALVAADYGVFGGVSLSGSPIAYGSLQVDAYNDFAIAAGGLGAIRPAGITQLGTRNANYDVAATPPTWSSGAASLFRAYNAENGTLEPQLQVTYTIVTWEAPVLIAPGGRRIAIVASGMTPPITPETV